MIRIVTLCLLMSATLSAADEDLEPKLAAPNSKWGGETIELPPPFARDMKLRGLEHIRFAPGMMQPNTDSFFSYAFVFELQQQPKLTEAVVKDEFLKYYRGLCLAVLNGKLPDLDPAKFTLDLQRVKADAKPDAKTDSETKSEPQPVLYTGTLDWVEPFATQKPQKLHLEIRTWTGASGNFLFACVSPQPKDATIWKQLHKIRDDYLKK